MEKYGFVYIWYDRKHKRFYIGCHWGAEDDGYICSSYWMKRSYLRRPDDFKRRILTKVYTTRNDLMEAEYKWLSLISENELKTKYYNIRKHHWNHWSADTEKRKSIGQKISAAWTPEKRAKASQEKTIKNPMKNPDVVEKRLETYKKGNHKAWNKGKKLGPNPEHSKRMKGRSSPNKSIPISDECREKLSKEWKIVLPNGETEIIKNLTLYCRTNNLTQANMIAVANGKRNHHKNYKCYRMDV